MEIIVVFISLTLIGLIQSQELYKHTEACQKQSSARDLKSFISRAKTQLHNCNSKLYKIEERTSQWNKSDAPVKELFKTVELHNICTKNLANNYTKLCKLHKDSITRITSRFQTLRQNFERVSALYVSELENIKERKRKTNELVRRLQRLHIQSKNISKILQIEQEPKPTIGFSVRMDNNLTLESNRKLIFETIITNSAGGFIESVFHCSEAGLYYFHAMICSQPGKLARAVIVKNDKDWLTFMYAEDKDNVDCGSNNVVIDLEPGNIVWIKSYHQSFYHEQSFFVGVLLNNGL